MGSTGSTYYQLAVRYFNGTLSLAEEEKLFQFVKESPENENSFRQWEAEWMLSSESQPEIDKEWIRLRNRMSVRNAGIKTLHIQRHRWMKLAAAVTTGIILLAGSFYGVRYYDNKISSENLFALETGMAEKTRLLLADGTTVYLNAGSSLQYAGNFNNRNREVTLSGEAYFEVMKQPGDIPFTVKTVNYDIIVKGTKFNVSAYPEDEKSSTTLISGAVEIVRQEERLSVIPNELIIFNKASGHFSREKVQADQYMAWTEGRFEYDKISLQELCVRLSRKYDVTIRLDEKIKKDVAFRISLRNEETIDDILKALSLIIPIQYKKNGRHIYIWQ